MVTIVRCNCGAEYKRTEAKFLVPHTGHASCKVCGATLESWLESTTLPHSSWSNVQTEGPVVSQFDCGRMTGLNGSAGGAYLENEL
jgi:hypothetical protein